MLAILRGNHRHCASCQLTLVGCCRHEAQRLGELNITPLHHHHHHHHSSTLLSFHLFTHNKYNNNDRGLVSSCLLPNSRTSGVRNRGHGEPAPSSSMASWHSSLAWRFIAISTPEDLVSWGLDASPRLATRKRHPRWTSSRCIRPCGSGRTISQRSGAPNPSAAWC